jgi:hypothetical protein
VAATIDPQYVAVPGDVAPLPPSRSSHESAPIQRHLAGFQALVPEADGEAAHMAPF